MEFKHLTETLSVSGQISEDDLRDLKARGVTNIINNRPDGEECGQPTSVTLRAAAERMGLSYAYIPVTPGQLNVDDADQMAAFIAAADGKTHAFCRSGNRSTHLWALGQRGQQDPDRLIKSADEAGHDISRLRPRLS
jgi:sulfide:quinone oxidoreductase